MNVRNCFHFRTFLLFSKTLGDVMGKGGGQKSLNFLFGVCHVMIMYLLNKGR